MGVSWGQPDRQTLKQTPQALLPPGAQLSDPHWEQFTDGDLANVSSMGAKYVVWDLAGSGTY